MCELNIFLIGPMGAGKSTIGRLLSQELKLEFVDSDREIEKRAGADIPWIFDVEGESGFRDREEGVIEALSLRKDIVLSTGGGAVLRPENRTMLQANGTVVYLETSVEQQLDRTSRDKNRPLLQTENPQAVLEELMSIRHPLYLDTADIVVVTDKRHPKTVVTEIIRQLKAKSPLEVE
ncbi:MULTISPECIES: shikimate kinase AroK [unclassified Neptuniibacter]|uniref:shikimate kinase AroK n=1 Tax=unclassified Neptuniibacter TaxID=2630693 RepID=UPI0026E154D3|nr:MULTISPECIES: shikimate kinase AroK [unclassified Neptuniibacter]MDO6513835.1 shikimate kinase AroK [Neptuniibacter sp. 2_MG-2023]MDO6593206.1 shikimate kinase AroK [Neptuniibacter sp. 1_MG-2023]